MKKVILILLCVLISSVANANTANVLSLQLLYGGMHTPKQNINNNPIANSSHNVGGFGYGIAVSHFFPENWMRLPDNLYFGLEGSYLNYANNKYDTLNETFYTYKANSLSALAVLNYRFDNNAVLIGKAGVARITQSLVSFGITTSLSRFKPQFQLGAGYRFNKRFQADLLYNYISGDSVVLGRLPHIVPVSSFNLVFSLFV